MAPTWQLFSDTNDSAGKAAASIASCLTQLMTAAAKIIFINMNLFT